MEFTAAIFDMDGTIIDGRDPDTKEPFNIHERAWELAAEQSGIRFDVAFHNRSARGLPLAEIDAVYRDRYGLDVAVSVCELKQTIYQDELLPKFQWYLPGAEEALDQLVINKIPIGIVTNAPSSAVSIINELLWLERYFDDYRVITVDEAKELVGKGKPDPGGALVMAQRLGAAPQECVFVGDTVADMKAAKSAGMFAVGIEGSDSKEQLHGYGADVVVKDLTGILEFFSSN